MNEKNHGAPAGRIIDLPWLRDRERVFRDRAHAGQVLAGMLEEYRGSDALILAIPAGGVPVGLAMAEKLEISMDIAVASKITLPWNTEAGYGAVAFDGTVRLNEELVSALRLTQEEIELGIEHALRKVSRRVKRLRGKRAFPALGRRPAMLVDDGLASGFTMAVAVEALRKARAEFVIVAVPTGHAPAVKRVARGVEALYCANLRGGWSFAVADAYEHWSDVAEEELARLLCRRSA